MRFGSIAIGSLSVLAWLACGCGGSGSSTGTGVTAQGSPTGKILPFASVQAMKNGTTFYVILDRPAGKIQAPVKLNGTSNTASGRQIYFTTASQLVGAGDSGALVIDSKGNSVGALDVVSAGSQFFTATAIEDEETVLLTAGAVKRTSLAAPAVINNGLLRVVDGVSPSVWALISKDAKNPIPKVFNLGSATLPKANHAARSLEASSLYGTTAYFVSSYGDAVLSYRTGAITTPYQGMLLALGGPLSWEGTNQDIPVYTGTTLGFVGNADTGCTLVGNPNLSQEIGALVTDGMYGVAIDPTVTATPIPITGSVTVNANNPVNFTGYVAQDAEYEYSFADLNLLQGSENILGADDVIGSSTGTCTINYTDGTSQSVNLTASDVDGVCYNMYYTVEEALYSYPTNIPPRLQSIQFSFQIVSGTYPSAPGGKKTPAKR